GLKTKSGGLRPPFSRGRAAFGRPFPRAILASFLSKKSLAASRVEVTRQDLYIQRILSKNI
ncbi:MAG: hypothetical protein AAGK05_11150, partial [Pseudomonadota bacterium]